MPAAEPVIVGNGRLYRLLVRGPARVSLISGTVRFESWSGYAVAEIPVSSIDAISTSRFLFWTRLTIRTGKWKRHAIGGLGRDAAHRVLAAIHEAAACNVLPLGEQLKHVVRQRRTLFSGERYVRHSTMQDFLNVHRETIRQVRGLCRLEREQLKAMAPQEYEQFVPFTSATTLESDRKQANDRFIRSCVPQVRAVAGAAGLSSLTDEQAEAIATDEDTTLVLAGAGTGKTSVITGKVAHLVRNQRVAPGEILVLAYNRKAADEIRERLPRKLAGADVSTFHRFGLKNFPVKPNISPLAEDDAKLKKVIDGFLEEMLKDPGQSESLVRFVIYNRAPWRPVFDFETVNDYNDYVRSVELRTLNGEKVKSFEELAIANFLAEYGVEYQYEEPYKSPTATRQHGQYRPDFYLPEHDIYIEHFALDEQGNPPPGWTGYAEGVNWKRDIHRQHETTLVETYSWQHGQDTLLPTLQAKLEEHGGRFERIPREELVQKLLDEKVSWLSELLESFLNHVKTSNLPLDELHRRAQMSGDRRRNERFLNVFEQVQARYEQLLDDENEIDFHDMINRAVDFLLTGAWRSPYRYILVDEFQDIAAGRMRLLETLKRRGVAYFLVGDDWQSIYRFAGSDVRLVKGCGEYLGHVQQRLLSRTFRYSDGILGPSTAFIQRNPEQTQRPLRSERDGVDRGITVVFSGDPQAGANAALQEIADETDGEQASVLVLGRFNFSRASLQSLTPDVKFSTVHGAKGREADYVIILDLKDDRRYGFPCRIKDDPLLELVLPPESGKAFPLAEERRLFYVALTRARAGVWLVTDKYNPSHFVKELLKETDGLRTIGTCTILPCPKCDAGNLVQSISRKNLRCTRSPTCGFLAPRCPHCEAGYVLVAKSSAQCTNTSCLGKFTVCPACGLGILLEKTSQYGRFWGCSTWTPDDPQCAYKRNYDVFIPDTDTPYWSDT